MTSFTDAPEREVQHNVDTLLKTQTLSGPCPSSTSSSSCPSSSSSLVSGWKWTLACLLTLDKEVDTVVVVVKTVCPENTEQLQFELVKNAIPSHFKIFDYFRPHFLSQKPHYCYLVSINKWYLCKVITVKS